MPLNELNKQLHGANSDELASRTHEKSDYDPGVSIGSQSSPFQQSEQWNAPQKGFSPGQKKMLWIMISIFLTIVLAIGGTLFYRWWAKNAFHQDRVTISFEGMNEADSTQVMKYVIHYNNNNRVTLKNAEIQLSYSENFQPTDNLNLKYLSPTSSKIFIGDIKPMTEGSIELKGVFYAPKDFPVLLTGQIHFVPSNGAESLFVENKIGVRVTAAPVILDISAPQKAVDGDTLEYVISYKNLDIKRISNAQVRVVFPQGFLIKDSQPKASETDGIWYIGSLEPSQGGEIRVHGQIKGLNDEGKNIKAVLGYIGDAEKFIIYDQQELTTRMVSPILTVVQKLDNKDNGIVSAGELLRYTVMFKNTGDIGLRDAIVTAEISGKILDFSKINAGGGSYDSGKNVITWKASEVPALANINPKAGGSVSFSIPVKAVIPIENKLDKNFTISSIAKIDSPDIPTPLDSNKIVGSNTLELKLASKVLFDIRGYYTDTKLKNSGPLPMETGKETTFAIHWSVVNISNDITEAKVISSLPTGVRWTGNIYPSNEKISYNSRTNQLIWDAGEVPAGAGAINPAREVIFQVGVTPQVNQIGEPLNLVNKSIFTAKDTFVDLGITAESESKNTQLYEDSTVGFANGKVAK